ncbi:hypothetical protein AZE42_08785 [Rhizopogon vesiculosus]|uniref:Uncharacterized protein n=1 Tax=Rhizopogon vesiculosus TaxID=180088 RepID=A0A1J8QST8_9AGAM|nr:hypothetical protein AZE42_08785 [Rhizopogon vesiculosus]
MNLVSEGRSRAFPVAVAILVFLNFCESVT